jgi:hypothetical protein
MTDSQPCRRRARLGRLDDLETSLDYLMSRFAAAPSIWVAEAVVAQLQILSGTPDEAGLSPRRRSTYRQLLPAWETIVRRLGALAPSPA